MSAPVNALGSGALDLPPFSLDVEVLNLGAEIKAVGLELLETESREPVRGAQAAQIWSASFPALAGEEFYALDFFSHLDRVRDFCATHEIPYREAAERCLVISKPSQEQLLDIFSRFETETFGLRVGPAALAPAVAGIVALNPTRVPFNRIFPAFAPPTTSTIALRSICQIRAPAAAASAALWMLTSW